MKRRTFLGAIPALVASPWMLGAGPLNLADMIGHATMKRSNLRISGIRIFVVDVTERTN